MNIIYIHTHDTGRYIEPYGHNVATPELMELAREGTLFRQAFCAAPTCSPSRAALLTGLNPHANGMLGLAHRGFKLKDYNQHLVQFLNNNGYETTLCGVQHVAPWDKTEEWTGYQNILKQADGNRGFAGRDLGNAKIAAEYIKEDKSKPFFLSFGMVNTHREFLDIDEDINPDYVKPPLTMYDCPETRQDMAQYHASVRVVDNCVGIITDAVRESGLEDDTMIIFTTDHGIAFPNMKCNLYDTGIGVSLIMKHPENPTAGQAVDALVSHLDLFPTICDLLDLEEPEWLEGNSMLPLLEGEKDKIRDEIFAEVTFHAAYEPMRCIRTKRYKLIKYFGQHQGVVPANIDGGYSKSFLLEHGLLEQSRDEEMLFDLYLDPVERVNLVNDDNYQQVYDDLSQRLEKWMEETEDPLLKGKVDVPRGAKINKISCIDPGSSDPDDYITG